ncbi:MAG: Sec-independent protein translocase protein TatB [Pseudomonadota bacterium]
MFDIGWTELLVLGSIALIVVGPKDLPGMLKTLGQTAGQAKRMAREFQRSMEDAAAEVDISKDMRDVQKSMADFSSKMGSDAPRKYAESLMNEEGQARKAVSVETTPASSPPSTAAGPAQAAGPASSETGSSTPPPASGA